MSIPGFYVYGIKQGETLVYVGKGHGKRVHKSLKQWGGDSYVIFVDDLSEADAFLQERVIIRAFRNAGIYLNNKITYEKRK